jgi:A/G-specific adenine glycosylase
MKNASDVAEAIARWYKHNHRPLPWRETHNPYAIWLSEVMLQQTQVVTVLPYYDRFLKALPTVHDLAMAPEQTVLKLWEGLGYYTRCRNLHKAARLIVEHHNGEFPKTLKEAEALPGLGKSTASAILTFAYGQAHPILDGNVKRVLSRLLNWEAPISSSLSSKALWKASLALVETCSDVYSLNQGLMELGASLCSTKNPSCLLCPVRSHCAAYAQGTVEERPVSLPKKAVPHKAIGVAVIWNEHGKLLVQQRPAEGLLGGLWEFPGGKQEADETLEETVHREIMEELALTLHVGKALKPVSHAYSHFKVTLYAYHCYLKPSKQSPVLKAAQAWQWLAPEDLNTLPFPTANRKLFEQISVSPFGLLTV